MQNLRDRSVYRGGAVLSVLMKQIMLKECFLLLSLQRAIGYSILKASWNDRFMLYLLFILYMYTVEITEMLHLHMNTPRPTAGVSHTFKNTLKEAAAEMTL